MNLKSNILKISVVIALIFILVPVIAAEDVDDSVYTESADVSVTEAIDDSVYTEAIDYTDELSESDDNLNENLGDDTAADATNDENNENLGDDTAADATDDENNEEQDETEDNADENDDFSVDAYGEKSADLEVSVITPYKKVHVGDITVLGIFVKNNGPDAASNVIVRAKLLSGNMHILAGFPSKGYYVIYQGVLYWYVGDLDAGENATLPIVGQVLSEEDIILVASVTSDTPDPDLSNNIAVGFIDVVPESSQVMHATGNPIVLALLALLSVVGISLRGKF